jgi:hypothetical protein
MHLKIFATGERDEYNTVITGAETPYQQSRAGGGGGGPINRVNNHQPRRIV